MENENIPEGYSQLGDPVWNDKTYDVDLQETDMSDYAFRDQMKYLLDDVKFKIVAKVTLGVVFFTKKEDESEEEE